MNKNTARQQAAELLDKLKAIDIRTGQAYYEMGQILSALESGDLYKELGYQSFSAMIEEELSFASSTAWHYMRTFREFKRLKYTKAEALKMIADFSWTHVSHVLPTLKQSISTRAMKTAVQKTRDDHQVISFMLTLEQRRQFEELLIAYGAERKQKNLIGTTDALLAIMNEFELEAVA